MSKKPPSSTSRIYARTHIEWQMVCATPSYYSYPTKGMARAAKPCQHEAAEGRQSHAAMSWQRADATSMTPPCVCGLRQHANAGAPSAVLFCCRRERSAKKMIVFRALGRVTAPHAHLTARPTHMASIKSLRTTAVHHGAHAAAALATRA